MNRNEHAVPIGLEVMEHEEQGSFSAFLKTDEGKLANGVWSALAEITTTNPNDAIFYGYYTQVLTNGGLALESLMRHHSAQSYAMLRNTSESICIALYSLLERGKSVEDFKVKDDQKKLKLGAYIWIKAAYPKYSKYLDDMKKEFYHKFGSHVSIAAVGQNFTIRDGKYQVWYLDQIEPIVAVTNLLLAVEFLLNYLEFMVEHGPKGGLIISDELAAKAKALRAELERLRAKNGPIFRAYQQKLHAHRKNA
jgi:hypothetical protein